ncbi:hypothetical protein FA15DRAFT_710472 [Coprinopsis marcescibilis]|uniref:Uncharacterized protein n=1 Tax=Coprinopsis marcescibilis TaxID=230819 RepID=A0A5C3KD51_COPMA|nr:hypothetical protein FA15DRAFT_710472 [Coprinopsis marcescibilis]
MPCARQRGHPAPAPIHAPATQHHQPNTVDGSGLDDFDESTFDFDRQDNANESEASASEEPSDEPQVAEEEGLDDPLNVEIPLTTLPPTNDMTTREQFQAIFANAQSTITSLEGLVKGLQLSNTSLKVELRHYKAQAAMYTAKSSSKKARKGNSDEDPKGSRNTSDYSKLCRRLIICHDMMIRGSAFLKHRPPPEEVDGVLVDARNHPDRYLTPDRRQMGQTDELYMVIPETMHMLLLSAPLFRDMIMPVYYEARRNIFNSFRAKVAYRAFAFLNPTPGIYDANQGPQRAEKPEFQDFIHAFPTGANPNKLSLYRAFMFPLLKKQGVAEIFRCEWIALSCRGIAFGPTSVPDPANPGVGGKIAANSTGAMWGLNELTPGFVALAVTATVFCHSSDTQFAEIGTESNINYSVVFSFVKKIIMEKLADPTSGMKDTIDYLANIVFKSGKGKNLATNRDVIEEGLTEALADLELTYRSDDDVPNNTQPLQHINTTATTTTAVATTMMAMATTTTATATTTTATTSTTNAVIDIDDRNPQDMDHMSDENDPNFHAEQRLSFARGHSPPPSPPHSQSLPVPPPPSSPGGVPPANPIEMPNTSTASGTSHTEQPNLDNDVRVPAKKSKQKKKGAPATRRSRRIATDGPD